MCSHAHTPVGTLIVKHHPPELELYMKKRGTVLSQGEGDRKGKRGRGRERERGGEGERGREGERERGGVLSQGKRVLTVFTNRKRNLGEEGGEERGVLLTHFHSGSCRSLQWSSTLHPAPLSQSHWLS